MGTISIIGGIILFVVLTRLRIRMIRSRCHDNMDRFRSLIKFPGDDTSKAEIIVAIGQLTATFWIIAGVALDSKGFEASIQSVSSSASITIGVLILPLLVFMVLVAGIALKD